jgi:hypothetical protein
MRKLRRPDSDEIGVGGLIKEADELIRRHVPSNTWWDRKSWLQKRLGCDPLSWLLSDPQVTRKPELLGLLECDPNYPAGRVRKSHSGFTQPRDWPAFTAGTQGDFASYVLSGIGRLARLLGHKGLVIIMDEMEKWQDLNWKEQTQAGNLLGGLIWAATAERGQRADRNRPRVLEHSLRCGGYPFTTTKRCHLGIAIAMTPRGEDDPEEIWCDYGRIEIAYLPRLTSRQLQEYCSLVAPHFAGAYGLRAPEGGALDVIEKEALKTWKSQSDLSMRSGVQSVIAALDHWRDEKQFRRKRSVL